MHHTGTPRLIAILLTAGLFLSTMAAGTSSGWCQEWGRRVDTVLSPDIPWEIFGDELGYDNRTQQYRAKGNVIITKGAQSLYADEAFYDQRTGIAEVWGNVRLKSGGDTFTGDHAVFNLQTQTGSITNGVLFLKQNHVYISGKHMEKVGPDTYLIHEARLTTCDGPDPAWFITGSKVRVTVEGYGTVEGASFRVKDLPVLYLPYMIFPAKTKRQTGLLPPRIGYSSLNGADIEIPFFWAISDQADATFYQRYLSQRGYMQGVEFNYILDPRSKGSFLADVLSDDESPKNMADSDSLDVSPLPRTNQTRYWLRGRADQALPAGMMAKADLDYVSDQDYLREFDEGPLGFDARPDLADDWGRPLDERYAPLRRSAVRVARDGSGYSLQGGSAYYQRPEDLAADRTAQPLGDLYFNMLPRKYFDFPMFTALGSDYTYVWRDAGDTGHRLSLAPEARFPFFPGRYLEFEPSVRYIYNARWIERESTGENDRDSNQAYELAAELSTNLDRIYPIDWMGARKLKHKIRPSFAYRYRSLKEEKQAVPWFEDIMRERPANVFEVSLENFLDARLENEKGAVSYRQWATFDLTQGYDIGEARHPDDPYDERPFTPLEADLVLRPLPRVDLRGNAQWDHYDKEIVSTTVSLDMALDRRNGLRDYYRLDYTYRRDGQQDLNFLVDVNLFYGLWAGTSLERNIEEKEDISSRYWLGYRSQCWATSLFLENTEADSRVGIMIELFGLGEIGAHSSWTRVEDDRD